jgi:hypothetical protein
MRFYPISAQSRRRIPSFLLRLASTLEVVVMDLPMAALRL